MAVTNTLSNILTTQEKQCWFVKKSSSYIVMQSETDNGLDKGLRNVSGPSFIDMSTIFSRFRGHYPCWQVRLFFILSSNDDQSSIFITMPVLLCLGHSGHFSSAISTRCSRPFSPMPFMALLPEVFACFCTFQIIPKLCLLFGWLVWHF